MKTAKYILLTMFVILGAGLGVLCFKGYAVPKWVVVVYIAAALLCISMNGMHSMIKKSVGLGDSENKAKKPRERNSDDNGSNG